MRFEPALRGYLEGMECKSPSDASATIRGYALETYLVQRGSSSHLELTAIGRVFLRLRGKDAIGWLLTNEVVQSMGENDPWRAPRVLFEWLRDSAIGTAYHKDTIERLVSFGVLVPYDDELGYSVREEMRDVAEAMTADGPWHPAVRTMLEEQRSLMVPGLPKKAIAPTIVPTHLVIQEMRNKLLPAYHDLRFMQTASDSPAIRKGMAAAQERIVQALNFIEVIAHMGEVVTDEQPSRFELSEMMRESLTWADTEHRVQWVPPVESWLLQAPRTGLTHAVSCVIINALQATTAGQPVRVSVARTSDRVRIAVDDGGPAVPKEIRNRIFEEGITMNDERGWVFGRAFVQRVVADRLGGKIWCEDSALGGARFVIELPQSTAP